MGERLLAPVAPWPGARVVVPVVSATGGVGRSTVAALLSVGLAASTGVVALADCCPRGGSPWAAWIDPPAGGGTGMLAWHAAALRGDRPLPPPSPYPGPSPWQLPEPLPRALSHFAAERLVHVYTDTTAGIAPVLAVPAGPKPWVDVLAGYRAVVADLPAGVVTEQLRAETAGASSPARQWLDCPGDVVVLLVTASTADAVAAAGSAVAAMEHGGVPPYRVVVAVVDHAGDPVAPQLLASLNALTARVGALVQVPYDPVLRNDGGRMLERAGRQTFGAMLAIAGAVLSRTSPPPPGPPPEPAGVPLAGAPPVPPPTAPIGSPPAPQPPPPAGPPVEGVEPSGSLPAPSHPAAPAMPVEPTRPEQAAPPADADDAGRAGG